MNKINLIAFCFAVSVFFSCKKTSHHRIEFPNLDVDPLTEAHKINNIKSYIKLTLNTGDTLIGKEIVTINTQGLITDRKGGMPKEHFTYDSLNRLIRYKYDYDTHFEDRYEYSIDRNNHEVLQYLVADSSRTIYRHFVYDQSFKKLTRTYQLFPGYSQPWENIIYQYSGNKILKIIHRPTVEVPQTFVIKKYIYDKNHKLKTIASTYETQYISRTTGLIDSATKFSNREYYIYYKK